MLATFHLFVLGKDNDKYLDLNTLPGRDQGQQIITL